MNLGVVQLNHPDCFKADSVFSGISTFGRLPYFPCLASDEEKYDIAFIGMFELDRSGFGCNTDIKWSGAPFDTGST